MYVRMYARMQHTNCVRAYVHVYVHVCMHIGCMGWLGILESWFGSVPNVCPPGLFVVFGPFGRVLFRLRRFQVFPRCCLAIADVLIGRNFSFLFVSRIRIRILILIVSQILIRIMFLFVSHLNTRILILAAALQRRCNIGLFCKALLQKRPIILRSLLIVTTPYRRHRAGERFCDISTERN